MKLVTIRPDEQHLGDLWAALQDMHLRAKNNPRLADDPDFQARLTRAHNRYFAAYERWAA